MLINKIISITIFSFVMSIQSSVLAAKIMGSFDFQGRSKYYGWKYRAPFENDPTKQCPDNEDPTKAKNLTDVTVTFMIHKVKQGDGYILDPNKKSTAGFKQTATNCPNPEAMAVTGQTYTVDITNATFGPKWTLKKIEFSGIVDPVTYPELMNFHDMNNPPGTFKPKDGVLSGFFNFMMMTAETKFTYTDVLDPENPKPFESDNIMFTKIPKIQDVTIKHIPEPSTILGLITIGGIALGASKKKKD